MRIQGLGETKSQAVRAPSAEQQCHLQVRQRSCSHSLFADVVFGGQSGGFGAESVVSQGPVLAAVVLETQGSHCLSVTTSLTDSWQTLGRGST